MVIRTLAHHIDADFLREAYGRTRKDGAAGIDGQTAADYAGNLEGNLSSLLGRFKSGRYRAPAVRRVHIPKGDGRTRPIGIPTFEDKVLQRAVVMVLEAVYEQDFLDCSYGFRPGRSAHDAVDALWRNLMAVGGGWVIDLDIQSFFDTLDREQLRGLLDLRVRDGVLRRTIGKWLRAGVMEAGVVSQPDAGTPQGGVISPLLANVYLHHVLDAWFERVVKPRLRGRAFLVRYADDAVIVCAREDDARRVMAVLPKRFGKYGLTLHPEKTRLICFSSPGAGRGAKVPTFDFLGFTHYWGQSRRGNWVVKKRTAAKRLRRSLKAINQWCRDHRHLGLAAQARQLGQKLRGHYEYYGVTTNSEGITRFYREVVARWRHWLSRRSQRGWVTWERMRRILAHHQLPRPRVAHRAYPLAANP